MSVLKSPVNKLAENDATLRQLLEWAEQDENNENACFTEVLEGIMHGRMHFLQGNLWRIFEAYETLVQNVNPYAIAVPQEEMEEWDKQKNAIAAVGRALATTLCFMTPDPARPYQGMRIFEMRGYAVTVLCGSRIAPPGDKTLGLWDVKTFKKLERIPEPSEE